MDNLFLSQYTKKNLKDSILFFEYKSQYEIECYITLKFLGHNMKISDRKKHFKIFCLCGGIVLF